MNRIKELREATKLSQAELAQFAGVTQPSISLYENDDVEPRWQTWVRLAKRFRVQVSYIQGLTDEPHNVELAKALSDLFAKLNKKADELGAYGQNETAYGVRLATRAVADMRRELGLKEVEQCQTQTSTF